MSTSKHQMASQFKSLSLLNSKCTLLEPEIDCLQRDADYYTRKYEQEKRKLILIQENYDNLKAELREKRNRIDKLNNGLKKTGKDQVNQQKIKQNQKQLEGSINQYNQLLGENRQLQAQINVLRKDRISYLEIHKKYQATIEQLQIQQKEEQQAIQKNRQQSELVQGHIYQLQSKNNQERMEYIEKQELLQKQIYEEVKVKEQSEKTKFNMNDLQNQKDSFDTSKLLKRRLQKIIFNNKEKVKVIEVYNKNMKIIEDAFNQIKEVSGILDIEEIANTFIKSEEQNHSLYKYADNLSQQIDKLELDNQMIREKIEMYKQELEDKNKFKDQDTTAKQHKIEQLNSIKQKKEQFFKQFNLNLIQITPVFQNLFLELYSILNENKLSVTDMNQIYTQIQQENFKLQENNVDQLLGVFEQMIDVFLAAKMKMQDENAPITNLLLYEEIPVKEFQKKQNSSYQFANEEYYHQSNKLLDQNAFQQFAMDMIDKKQNQSALSYMDGRK